jgi:NADPH-dependent 2,4-dienoyl-CoA reductase/sulfur reductase-like enzyme
LGQETYDLLVVGGGPCGLAATADAAHRGLTVGLVDERVTLGGQIYKQPGPGFRIEDHARLGPDHRRGRALIDAVERSAARVLTSTSVVALRAGSAILVEDGERARSVTARRVIIAAGAHDRPVVFPGWTLPGVLTAGGAQSLVKSQRVLPGERIVFAGNGPVALAFPAQLHGYGASVALVLEAGPPPRPADVAAMLRAARGNAVLLRDAARYRTHLMRARIPLRYRRIVVRAEGDQRVQAVTHARVDADWRVVRGTERTVEADTLCVGYGFVPSIELARLAGCALAYDEDRGGHTIRVDPWMRTSVGGVYAAGDGTGIDGSYVAEDEGRLAALSVARDLGAVAPEWAVSAAGPIRSRIARKRAFASALGRMHRVGSGIFDLADGETIVCRCEEVTRWRLDAAIATSADLNVVKGLTRAGMGLCQGRMCQRQVAAMIAARHGGMVDHVEPATPRLPARPVALGAIAQEPAEDAGLFQ